MKAFWFGHSAFRFETGGAIVLIDPFFTGNPAFSGDVAAVSAGATHILLTHGHGDHVGDTVAIAKATGAKVVANYDLAMWLGSQGVASLEPMNTGGTVDCGAFAVSMVRADHSAGMGEAGVQQPIGSANGLVLKPKDGPVVYHMGDTDIFGDMALIAEIHKPQVGLVPVGDRFTMGPEVAALAVNRFFAFDTVIPCHYGSFDLVRKDADPFVRAMAGSRTKVLVPEKGKPFTL